MLTGNMFNGGLVVLFFLLVVCGLSAAWDWLHWRLSFLLRRSGGDNKQPVSIAKRVFNGTGKLIGWADLQTIREECKSTTELGRLTLLPPIRDIPTLPPRSNNYGWPIESGSGTDADGGGANGLIPPGNAA